MFRPARYSRHRMVVGEVAVVDQGLVQPDERMRAAGMPHAALGRIALVGDPNVGPRVRHPIILHRRLGKSDDLHDQQVPRVRHHERPLVAQRGVILIVQPDRVLVDELVFDVPLRHAGVGQPLLLGEAGQHVGLDADEVSGHVGRANLQQRHVAIIVHRRNQAALVHVEIRLDERLFHLAPGARNPTGRPEGYSPRRAPCATRPCLPAPVRRRRCRRPCRCPGCASGSKARRCAGRRRGSCRRSRSRRSRLRPRAMRGNQSPWAARRRAPEIASRGQRIASASRAGRVGSVESSSSATWSGLNSGSRNPDGSADRSGPATTPRSRVPGDRGCRPASRARRCTCSPAAAYTSRP